jgi:hypothetical protein
VLREVERSKHGKLLKRQLGRIEEEFKTVQKSIADQELPEIEGLVLQILTEPGYPIGPTEIHSLTSRTGIRSGPLITLLNAIQITDSSGLTFTRIALHVPFGALSYLENKVREFSEKSGKKGHPTFQISKPSRAPRWTRSGPTPIRCQKTPIRTGGSFGLGDIQRMYGPTLARPSGNFILRPVAILFSCRIIGLWLLARPTRRYPVPFPFSTL